MKKYLKIKSLITSFHSSLCFWFLWPIKKSFHSCSFFWFLCLASNRFLWLCTFFLRGTMKHRSSTGCWLRADAKKKLANPFGQISIYFGLAEWPYYGRPGSADWAVLLCGLPCPVGRAVLLILIVRRYIALCTVFRIAH